MSGSGIDDLCHHRPTAGERAGFVESHDVDARGALEMRTAFDQDAAPGRAADGGKNGRRGANDQGARRGNDHHGHRTVEGLGEGCFQKEKWHNENQRGEGDHAGGVVLLSLFEEPLGAGFLGLRLFDELHHPRQRGILGPLGDGKLEAAALVESSCEDLASRGFGDRHRFAGEAGFIDVARSFDDHSIDWHMLTGAQDDDIADGEFLDFHEHIAAGAFHHRLVGPELEEGVDRLLGSLEGIALEDIREAEEKQQQRALKGLADYPCANRGQNHEHIDIQHTPAERGDGGTDSLLAAEKVGSRVKNPCCDGAFSNRVVGDKRGD